MHYSSAQLVCTVQDNRIFFARKRLKFLYILFLVITELQFIVYLSFPQLVDAISVSLIVTHDTFGSSVLEVFRKKCPRDPTPFFPFFRLTPIRSGRRFVLMQPCGGGTRTREGALVSTIIRVSSRRMSFINARGKLRPYTCIYTSDGERNRKRKNKGGKRKSEMVRGREETAEAKYPSFCFVPGGWALALRPLPSLLSPCAPSLSYYYYFLSQYLLFPHSVLC